MKFCIDEGVWKKAVKNTAAEKCYATKGEVRKEHLFFGPLGFLGEVEDLPPKLRLDASLGVLWLEMHGRDDMAPWRESYVEYVRADKKRPIEILKYNMDYLLPMIRLNMIPTAALRPVREIVEKEGNAEHMAALRIMNVALGRKLLRMQRPVLPAVSSASCKT